MRPGEQRAATLFDVVIIGEPHSGKSDLINNFTTDNTPNDFDMIRNYKYTGNHSFQVGNNSIHYELKIWDPSVDRHTIGYQTNYITDSLKQSPHPLAVIFVCDLTAPRGLFDALKKYHDTVNEHPQDPLRPMKKILIGTRTDPQEKNYVTEAELSLFAQQNNITFAGVVNEKDRNSVATFFESIVSPALLETLEGQRLVALNKISNERKHFMQVMLLSSLLVGVVGFLIPYFVGVSLLYSAILGGVLFIAGVTTLCCCIHCKNEPSMTENAQLHESIGLLATGPTADPSHYEQPRSNNLIASDANPTDGGRTVAEGREMPDFTLTFTTATNILRH